MATLLVADFPWVNWAQLKVFDAYQQLKPRPWTDAGVRVIDIDDASLRLLGQWPWPRTQVAELARRLHEAGAAAVVFDVVFAEPDRTSPAQVAAAWPDAPADLKERLRRLPDNDGRMADVLRGRPVVLAMGLGAAPNAAEPARKASFAVSGPDPLPFLAPFAGAETNRPELEKAAAGLGVIIQRPDMDQIIRRVPLVFRLRDRLLPALSVEALRVAQGASTIQIKTAGGSGEDSGGAHTGLVKVKIGSFLAPVDGEGSFWVHYSSDSASRTIPAWRVFRKDFGPGSAEGAICLVGTSALGLKDIRSTPLNPAAAGVEVHANVIEQIVTGSALSRPDWARGAELVVLLASGVMLLLLLSRAGAEWGGLVAAASAAGVVWASWRAFADKGWLVDPLFPVLGIGAVHATWSVVSFVRSEASRRRITATFGRYLSPKVVAKLADDPKGVELGGETREMTFHFCDIRGFTTISEKFDPHGLTEFINRFLTPMTEIILAHDGTIDKYMGDCIMAFWNAPVNVPDHARKACAAALAMHAKLAELNARWQAEAKAAGRELPEIHIGTGLNTGPCVVGNMGSTLRVDYTVLGDDVNLASRLEGQSKSYGVGIVIGPATRDQAPEFAAVELDLIKVKGKTRPVRIFALLGDPAAAASEPFRALSAAHEAMLSAYRGKRWDEAASRLTQARALGERWGLGKLHDLYESRLAAFRAEPPPPDWDGVYVALSK